MRCDQCKFWDSSMFGSDTEPWHEDDRRGKCRRFPPQIDSVYAGKREDEDGEGSEALLGAWQFPLTAGGDWCGEYEEKK